MKGLETRNNKQPLFPAVESRWDEGGDTAWAKEYLFVPAIIFSPTLCFSFLSNITEG